MPEFTAHSPAKINLTLRVLGVRPDGFHELESLVALLEFGDTIRVTPSEDGAVTVACDVPGVPTDDSNLVVKAARRLQAAADVQAGAHIEITKRIPTGAGLGGGSSNAAAALSLLNRLWSIRLADDALATLGADVGSDVPLFFHGPLCVMRGRGERVERLAQRLSAWVLLIMPGLHCSTPAVYRAFDAQPTPAERPSVDSVLSSSEPAAIMEQLFNDLESAAFEVEPQLASVARDVERAVGAPLLMTGSGSALFRLYATQADAERAAEACCNAVNAGVTVTRIAAEQR